MTTYCFRCSHCGNGFTSKVHEPTLFTTCCDAPAKRDYKAEAVNVAAVKP